MAFTKITCVDLDKLGRNLQDKDVWVNPDVFALVELADKDVYAVGLLPALKLVGAATLKLVFKDEALRGEAFTAITGEVLEIPVEEPTEPEEEVI